MWDAQKTLHQLADVGEDELACRLLLSYTSSLYKTHCGKTDETHKGKLVTKENVKIFDVSGPLALGHWHSSPDKDT